MINQPMPLILHLDHRARCAINRVNGDEKLDFIACIAKNLCVNSIHMPGTRALNAVTHLYIHSDELHWVLLPKTCTNVCFIVHLVLIIAMNTFTHSFRTPAHVFPDKSHVGLRRFN